MDTANVVFSVCFQCAASHYKAAKRRRHETAFRNILRSLVPPVEPNSQWEVIRPKIENEDAFLAVESEQLREKFFKDYIQCLAEACGHHHGSSKKKKKEKKKRRKEERESGSEADNKRRKRKKHHRSDGSDDEKDADRERKRKKKKRRRSRSLSGTPAGSNESELSETELEQRRRELLTKLDSSPHSA